jgi:hypothetical protein
MPIHITMQEAFALRNLLYTADSIIQIGAIPIFLIVVAWLGRRDIMRAVRWSAIFALVFTLLYVLAIAATMALQREPYDLTLAHQFILTAIENAGGAAEQLALEGGALVAALSLLSAAQRGRWRWFWLLGTLTALGIILHGASNINATLFIRNFLPLAYLPQQAIIGVVLALLPIAALLFTTHLAATTSGPANHDTAAAINEIAPAQQS